MNKPLLTKLGLSLFFISLLFGFILILQKTEKSSEVKPDLNSSVKKENFQVSVESAKVGEEMSRIVGVAAEPTPFIKQQGKVRGENSIIKFEKDLETSLKLQKLPKIWLEFIDENNQVKIVRIPKQAEEILQKRWVRTLDYSYKNLSANDSETKFSILKSYYNDAAVFAKKIDTFEITTPLEKRKISEEEAFAMVHLTAKFAIERCKELQNMALQTNPLKISEWNF